jgi:MGT family glycosyltransferase
MTAPSNRTYLFALVDGGGTVPPELGAVRRLVERGHRVTVLAEDSMAHDVAATGAEYVPWTTAPNRASRLPQDDPYRDWECKTPFQLMDRLLDKQFAGPADAYAADVRAAIARRRPDLVVCSMFAVGAMIAAEAEAVPYDVLLCNCYLLPAEGMPPFGLGLRPAKGPLGRVRDRVATGLSRRLWARGLPRINEVRADHGLEPLTDFFEPFGAARRVLVLTSQDFDFPAQLPDNVRYVGPVLDDPTWATGTWTPPPGDEPLVLVGLSSTYQDQLGTLQRIVAALASLPVRAIVTTGPAIDPADLDAPGRIHVVRSAPHSEVLGHAAAAITHGGHGTVVRGLAAGVPLVVMHHGRDQADNAVRVTTRGAGLSVSRRAKPDAIATAVRRVLDDGSFRTNARRLGDALRRDAASGRLVAELEDLAPAASGPRARPAPPVGSSS